MSSLYDVFDRDSLVPTSLAVSNNATMTALEEAGGGVGYLCFASQISTDPSNATAAADAERLRGEFIDDLATS